MVTETPACSKLVLHSSTMPVPSRPEVTKSTCLKPIAAASGPACSYAPAPSSDRGCLKNSFTGNSNIREVSTIDVTPFLQVDINSDHKRSPALRNRVPAASCYRCSNYQPLSRQATGARSYIPRSTSLLNPRTHDNN